MERGHPARNQKNHAKVKSDFIFHNQRKAWFFVSICVFLRAPGYQDVHQSLYRIFQLQLYKAAQTTAKVIILNRP
jgi:hypothetical protein